MRASNPIFCKLVPALLFAAALPVTAPALLGQLSFAPTPPAIHVTTQPAAIRFQTFVIRDDPTYTGMEVTRGIMPAGWRMQGGVVWDLRNGFPAQFRLHASDPRDVAAFDVYPNHLFFWSARAAQSGGIRPDSRYMGQEIQAPPADQFQALAQIIIPRYRTELARAQVVEQEKLPKVAQAAFDNMFKPPGAECRAAAGRARFEYELQGQTVQEDMYVVFKSVFNPRFRTISWAVENVTSTRGPKGTLEQLNATRAIMAQSARPNVEWFDKVSQFILMRQHTTMQQLADQEQRRQIFMKMQQKVSEENKQAFENHMRDIDRQSDSYADYMREVSPWKTANGSSLKLPNQYGQAWQGTNGEILMNNDPLYNPNSDPSESHATWTRMEQAPR